MSRHLPIGQVKVNDQGSEFTGTCKFCSSVIIGSWRDGGFSGWATDLGVLQCP